MYAHSLEGRTVLVTGASAGIGAAIARAAAHAGARVLLAARRADRLADLAASLPTEAHALALDVRDAGSVEGALAALPEPWRSVDVLVNNAGLGRDLQPVYENSLDGIAEVIETNVTGLLAVTRAVVPGMLARGRGHVVNIGSIAGRQVYPGGTVYCASKAAVAAITEGLKMDLHGTPIRVTNVEPGLVETEFSLIRFRGDAERAEKVYADTTPLTPDDVADAVLYAITRPAHVCVADMLLIPTAQSSVTMMKRG